MTAAVLSVFSAGCALVPSSGPTSSEISSAAATTEGKINFILREIDESIVSILSSSRDSSFMASFGDQRPAPQQRIGIGDTVNVTIWEAGAGGLFSSASIDRNSAGSRSAVIPEQVVARDGSVTVPYAGRIRVVGLTTPEVERRIVKELTGKAIEPQVLVTVPKGHANSVTVLGEVTNGARVPLSVKGDRILDVLAQAGGVRAAAHESFVSLQRGNRSVAVPLQRLIRNPSENVFAHPGDVLTVVRQPQTFTVFGAAGHNSVVPFDAAGLTLEQAIARAGGLVDYRSDPQGVFLLRFESAEVARQLDPAYAQAAAGTRVPVIYRLNMRDPRAYFLAQTINIRHRDMIYVANAPITELTKFLQMFVISAQGAATVGAVGAAF